MKRAVVLTIVALGFLFGSPGVASADVFSNSGYTYQSNADCAWVHTTIRNDWARPHIDTVATIDWWGNGRACGAWATIDANRLAVRQDLMVWNQWTGGMEWCSVGPWITNQGRTHELWTSWGWASSPCWQSDWYFVVGRSMTRPGNEWHGGGIAYASDWIWTG